MVLGLVVSKDLII